MTPQELYERIGGDYDEALGRMRMDKLIGRLIVKFLDDTSAADLAAAWAAGDKAAAFNAAHTLKGVAMNLALPRIAEPANQVTEALRPGNEGTHAGVDVDALVAAITEAHREAIEGIQAFAAEAE